MKAGVLPPSPSTSAIHRPPNAVLLLTFCAPRSMVIRYSSPVCVVVGLLPAQSSPDHQQVNRPPSPLALPNRTARKCNAGGRNCLGDVRLKLGSVTTVEYSRPIVRKILFRSAQILSPFPFIASAFVNGCPKGLGHICGPIEKRFITNKRTVVCCAANC